jgi:hypothetical protein
MEKKIIVIVVVLVIVLGLGFILMRRSHMMGNGLQSSGGLMAVTRDGTPLPPPPTTDTVTQLLANTAAQQVGDMNVSIALNPYPPTGFNPADFEVTLTDANGQAINDATVSLDLTMPTMWMPTNQFPLTSASNGKYSATGQFTMRGLWRIEVVITRGGKTQSAFFDVGL